VGYDEEKVWAYLLKDRQATAHDVALNCDVTEAYAEELMSKISSPNWREDVSAPLTGGVKFDADKARYDLIPPEIEEAIAKVLTFGAVKYGERNWELGMRWGRPYAALRRHMTAWWSGENTDPETGMPHTWHAACCIAFIVAFEARGAGTDDRPDTKTNTPDITGSDQEPVG
jgi:hypothetical protein